MAERRGRASGLAKEGHPAESRPGGLGEKETKRLRTFLRGQPDQKKLFVDELLGCWLERKNNLNESFPIKISTNNLTTNNPATNNFSQR